jgi:hypothetical protein
VLKAVEAPNHLRRGRRKECLSRVLKKRRESS